MSETMEREEIDDVICQIMRRDGPDRHIDGHSIITDFVMALLKGRAQEWVNKYDAYNED